MKGHTRREPESCDIRASRRVPARQRLKVKLLRARCFNYVRGRTSWCAQNLNHLHELVLLKRYGLLRVHLSLFALEYWSQADELSENATYCPAVDGLVIMLCSEEKLWGTVPDGDNNLVASGELLEWLVDETRKTKIANLDLAGGGDENVGRLEITVEDMCIVEVDKTIEKLVRESLENGHRNTESYRVRMVVDNLL